MRKGFPNTDLMLLHSNMLNKKGEIVTTSLTLNDIQDLARSAATYGINRFYIEHPSTAMRRLAERLMHHWVEGFGAGYNPIRKEAMERVRIKSSLADIIEEIKIGADELCLIATSAKKRKGHTISFKEARELISNSTNKHFGILLGTGWGMADELISKAEYLLEPIRGVSSYNHLSVRAAGAVILDRLFGRPDR